MKLQAQLSFISVLATFVAAHGPDEHGGHGQEGNTNYAERHMASEHHIDAFNPSTFFQLHDLDRNDILDRNEIEAIYGVHHVYSKQKTPNEEAQAAKAAKVADAVLAAYDTNGDGFITMDEFLAKGLDALPDFSSLGAEGHHYDVESEFFLHHEELYHNTPETQTDESYNHKEDLEHFAHHEEIEKLELEREHKYEGLAEDGIHAAPPDEHPDSEPEFHDAPKYTYTRARKDGQVAGELDDLKREAAEKDAYGTGNSGFARPKAASDRLRKNVPYKYKFKRNWGDF